jgi:hypothetical protein
MAKAKVVFKLDETDQITIHGHTLSRIVIDGFKIGSKTVTDFPQSQASYRSNEQYWIMAKPVGTKGGYIDSLDNISTNVANNGLHAWIDENSWVYESTIGPYVHILHSNVLESTIQSLGPSMNTVHNPYEHLLVRAYGVIENSCVKSSTLVNVSAYDSNIEFSDVKRITAYDAQIRRSNVEMKSQHWIADTNLNMVNGTVNETMYNTNLQNIQFGNKKVQLKKNNDEFLNLNLDAVDTSSNTNVICVLNNSTKDYHGDNQTNLDTLSYYVANVDDWTDTTQKNIDKVYEIV